MSREELKRLFLTFPTIDRPVVKEIKVRMGKSKFWPGYGDVTITKDGPNGFSEFKTHQEFPMKYAYDTKEYKSGEYKLTIK